MNSIKQVDTIDHVVDNGMDMFNKFIERSCMEKKTYQYDGVKWLLQNELSKDLPWGIRGGFVADEMGLGKTIMMIGLCIANFMHNRTTLIVLPPVLIEQWFAQIYKTTGHKCIVYHGENKKIYEKKALEGVVDIFAGAVIVLCSYDAISIFREKNGKKGEQKHQDWDRDWDSVARNEASKNKHTKKVFENSLLHRIKWGRVIFDEAHHLRNKNTSRYVGAKMLAADVKWLVSGTPVQNRKQDFYALCSLINLPASYYTDPGNFNDIGRKFILKRTKKQVGIDLVDAVQTKNIVPWKSEAEKKFSKEIHSLIAFTNVKLSEQKVLAGGCDGVEGDSDSDMGLGSIINQSLLLLLLRARQSCIYPKMVKSFNVNDSLVVNSSSKLDSVVDAIMERKDNGNGKLVFCHFKEEMNELADRLRAGGLNVGILDGTITKNARHKLLSEKKDVLILQIQTGCEGLNLQDNYNEIYFVSPHWNPYVEDQAIARCHRIGQKKPVFVWRFEMTNFDSSTTSSVEKKTKNLEEYVVDVQNGKRNIVNNLIVEE
jgi:SNF2 family DNA or RNA helicase